MQPRLFTVRERPALLEHQPSVWLLSVPTRQTLRVTAHALLESLIACYGDPGTSHAVQHAPGQPPGTTARWRGLPIGISLSYADNYALLALCPGAQVGVDLVRVEGWPELLDVARLYLGARPTVSLQGLSRDAQVRAFADAWAALEARCKCYATGLTEWSPARDAHLADARLTMLAAPPGYAAAQAVR